MLIRSAFSVHYFFVSLFLIVKSLGLPNSTHTIGLYKVSPLTDITIDEKSGDVYVAGEKAVVKLTQDLERRENVTFENRVNNVKVVYDGNRRSRKVLICSNQDKDGCYYNLIARPKHTISMPNHIVPMILNSSVTFCWKEETRYSLFVTARKGKRASSNVAEIGVFELHFRRGISCKLRGLIMSKAGYSSDYIYGWKHGEYAYLIRQGNARTHLLQLHLNSSNGALTLIQIELRCGPYIDGLKAISAYFHECEDDKVFLCAVNDSALYVNFYNPGSDMSKMCSYPMQEIEHLFTEVSQKCFRYHRGSTPGWMKDANNFCQNASRTSVTINAIGNEGDFINGTLVLEDEEQYLDIAVSKQCQHFVIYARTNASLKQWLISTDASKQPLLVDTNVTVSKEAKVVYKTKPALTSVYIAEHDQVTKVELLTCDQCTSMGCTLCEYGYGKDKHIRVCSTEASCKPRSGASSAVPYNDCNIRPAVITKWGPRTSPMSGTTLLKFTGTKLAQLDPFTINIGGYLCPIISRRDGDGDDEDVVLCRVPALKDKVDEDITNGLHVNITVDGQMSNFPDIFTYFPDPVIGSFEPKINIESGGLIMTLYGSNLQTMDGTVLVFRSGQTYCKANKSALCTSTPTGDALRCMTPNCSNTNYPADLLLTSLDDTPENHTFTWTSSLSPVEYRPDPHIDGFWNGSSSLKKYRLPYEPDENYTIRIRGKGFSLPQLRIVQPWCCHDDEYIMMRVPIINKTDEDIFFTTEHWNTHKQAREVLVFIGNSSFYVGTFYFTKRNGTRQPAIEHITTPVSQQSAELQSSFQPVVVLAVVIILLVIVVVLFVVIYKCRRRLPGPLRQRLFNSTNNQARVVFRSTVNCQRNTTDAADDAEANPSVSLLSSIERDVIRRFQEEALLIERDDIIIGEKIGQGHFGCVYRGELLQGTVNEPTINVAVKTLHENNRHCLDVKSFLDEALVMKSFDHKNVMSLLGVCLGTDDLPLVILPYMEHGDLHSYLRNEANTPSVKELALFGLDIANGMSYLASLKFVHRDLAARNCMMDEKLTVKVADFGLSRDIYETDYYSCKDKRSKLPVKWMPPESLTTGIFNEMTDVWSFAVVLWELTTRGMTPYPSVDNWDLERFLMEGRRLPQPKCCPAELYRLMRRCWKLNPDERPIFKALAKQIKAMIEKVEQIMGKDDEVCNIENTYVNLNSSRELCYENKTYPYPLD